MGFQQLTCPPTLLLVSQRSNLAVTRRCRTRVWHLTQIGNHVKGIMGSISLGNPWNPTHPKLHMMISRRLSLDEEWNSFHLPGKKLNYLHLQNFLKYECELYSKQPLTPPQCKIVVAYHASNHRLVIDIWRWTTIHISRNNKLCKFCPYNVVEYKAHFVWECPL